MLFIFEVGYEEPKAIDILLHMTWFIYHTVDLYKFNWLQAPDTFVAAAARNPVCNLSLMVGTTDIPDWCFVEIYGKEGKKYFSESPSVDDLCQFHQKSPISHISKVCVDSAFYARTVSYSYAWEKSRGLICKWTILWMLWVVICLLNRSPGQNTYTFSPWSSRSQGSSF